jgi:hypothetical protein
MPRRLRYVPDDETTFEFTYRAREGRFSFVPQAQLKSEWVGVLHDACVRYPAVELVQIHLLSNHVTGQLTVRGAMPMNQLGLWEAYVFGQTALVSHAVHGQTGEIWESRRCRLIPLLDEESVAESARYIMAQAVAANLVARPRHWPGLNTCDALCRGAIVRGYRANAALRRTAKRDKVPLSSIAPAKALPLKPLPMHRGWSLYDRQKWYRDIERSIIEEAEARNVGRVFRSAEALRSADPHQTVEQVPTNPPTCYAAKENHEARRTWRQAYRAFVAAWREALAAWVDGGKPCFPRGGWVPFAACGSLESAPAVVQRE